jgi:hypothetical protein
MRVGRGVVLGSAGGEEIKSEGKDKEKRKDNAEAQSTKRREEREEGLLTQRSQREEHRVHREEEPKSTVKSDCATERETQEETQDSGKKSNLGQGDEYSVIRFKFSVRRRRG